MNTLYDDESENDNKARIDKELTKSQCSAGKVPSMSHNSRNPARMKKRLKGNS